MVKSTKLNYHGLLLRTHLKVFIIENIWGLKNFRVSSKAFNQASNNFESNVAKLFNTM